MPRSPFKHFILPEGDIRLLTLYDTVGQVSCSLGRHDFNRCPDYIALSYAWGPPPPEHEILVNGQPFMIRENLYECLASLLLVPHEPAEDAPGSDVERSEPVAWGKAPPPSQQIPLNSKASSTSRKGKNKKGSKPGILYFWIDQLCIDQRNIPERNKQVAMMDEIYSRAKETLIWVGPNKSTLAEREMLDLDLNYQRVLDYDPLSADIYRICAKPYWTRLWIVQEVLLSKAIVVRHGEESYTWDLFESLAKDVAGALGHGESTKKLDRHQDTIAWRRQGVFKGLPDGAACLLNDRWSDVGPAELTGGRKLSDLVSRFAGQGCEMSVDKVFGLQGLIPNRARIVIDYELSPEELFYKVVDKLADVEGDELFEDEQLDVCLAMRREMKIEPTAFSSQSIAETVFGHVKKRLEYVGQDLSPEEEEIGLEWYVKYLANPGSTHIPSEYRVNDFARGTYKEFLMEQAMDLAVGRAKLKRFMEEGETMKRRKL